jgi:ribulose-phosphate 3-epimerase
MKKITIAASLACANFRHLEKDILELEQSGVDYIHIDVMDGLFVPNLALDFSIMGVVSCITRIPLECHLMIVDPERYIERIALLKPEFLSVHAEATRHLHRTLKYIRSFGMKSGVALNPATPIETLTYIMDEIDLVILMTVNPGFSGQQLIPSTIRKIADTREMLDKAGFPDVIIQVDGNVSFENIPVMVKAGASMLVGGSSSVFHKDYSIRDAVSRIREITV